MANLNKVMLMGNLTRDPQLRFTANNTATASFGVAVNRRWKNQAGEQQEEVTFIDVDAWSRTAEVINQYFRKGDPIYVEGRLKLEQWDDKQSGQKRSKLKVVVEQFQFIGGKRDGQQKESSGTSRGYANAAADGPHEAISEENIPF